MVLPIIDIINLPQQTARTTLWQKGGSKVRIWIGMRIRDLCKGEVIQNVGVFQDNSSILY